MWLFSFLLDKALCGCLLFFLLEHYVVVCFSSCWSIMWLFAFLLVRALCGCLCFFLLEHYVVVCFSSC